MPQNALTVTPPSPTPPTNLVNSGSTPPNPATFDPTVYVQATTGDGHYPRPELAPFYDDSITQSATNNSVNEPSGSRVVFAAKKAALAVGGTSADHEGLGTEVLVTAPGSRTECPTQMVSVLGSYTSTPNAQHASCLSNAATPTISGVSAGGASGIGTTLLTVTGTNYTRASVVNVNGVPQQTNYVSATSLTVTNAPKKPTAGTVPVTVTSGGITTAPTNWTFT